MCRSSFIFKFTLVVESCPCHSVEITNHFLHSLSFIAASLPSFSLCSLLAIGALIEALLSHVYHRGNIALRIIIVLCISITTEEKLCFNPTNTEPSSFVLARLRGLSYLRLEALANSTHQACTLCPLLALRFF